MGIKLIVEILDHWRDAGLTAGERDDLIVLAENANDGTRLTWGAVHEPYILKRAGKGPASWKNSIGKLIKRGVLVQHVAGRIGQVAVYRLSGLCPEPPHDGRQGFCTRPERVTPQVTLSKVEGHLTGVDSGQEGHLTGVKRVTPEVTPSPLCSSTTSSLSSPPPATSTSQPPAPPDEREKSAAPSNDNDPATVTAAWTASRGGRRNPAAERDIAASALQLLDAGWPLADVTALAEDMARRQPTYRDLTRHADHWQPARPAAGAAPSLPPWCGACDGEELAMRWRETPTGAIRCPDCNPHARAA